MARLKKETRSKKQIQEQFLLKLEEVANVTAACKASRISRRTIYNWLKSDKIFKKQYKQSEEIAISLLEDEARRRAFQGVKKPVYQKGGLAGYVREYSDTLLIFLLKSHKREVYGDKIQQELTGKNGQPIQAEVKSNVDYKQLPTEVLEAIISARIKTED